MFEGDTDSCDKRPKNDPITDEAKAGLSREVSRLLKAIEFLEEDFDKLSARLTPVMIDHPKGEVSEDKVKDTEVEKSVISSQISASRGRVQMLKIRVRRTLEHLDI